MDISKIPAGRDVPRDVNVVIEIPLGGVPVKYEVEKESGAMFVDRFLHTAMFYPCNYGFIPHTLADDGDPVDVLVAGPIPVMPEDEAGQDEKILSVPVDDLHPYYSNISNYSDLRGILLDQISHFFEHYKDLEEDKWVRIVRWGDAEEASDMIVKALVSE